MPKDPIAEDKAQRDTDRILLKELIRETDERGERAKHCLQALVTAVVPLDLLTARVLCEIGHNMGALIVETPPDE